MPILCEVSIIILNDGLEMHSENVHCMNSWWEVNVGRWRGQADVQRELEMLIWAEKTPLENRTKGLWAVTGLFESSEF